MFIIVWPSSTTTISVCKTTYEHSPWQTAYSGRQLRHPPMHRGRDTSKQGSGWLLRLNVEAFLNMSAFSMVISESFKRPVIEQLSGDYTVNWKTKLILLSQRSKLFVTGIAVWISDFQGVEHSVVPIIHTRGLHCVYIIIEYAISALHTRI